jgi:hypothetical protein
MPLDHGSKGRKQVFSIWESNAVEQLESPKSSESFLSLNIFNFFLQRGFFNIRFFFTDFLLALKIALLVIDKLARFQS